MATRQTVLRLGRRDDGRPVSADEFAEADFDEPWKYERVAGKLIVMAPEGFDHQVTAEPWRDALVLYKRDRPGVVRYVFSNPWLPIPGGDRIGDLGVFLAADPIPPPGVEPVPAIVVEVVSPGRRARDRDYVEKRDAYHALGVREYVVVDRFARTATVLTHAPDGYAERVLSAGATYTTPLLPGLAIALADVFG